MRVRVGCLLVAAFCWLSGHAFAQGMLEQGVAQTVISLPGSAQGASSIFVPIPNAIVRVCSGTYAGIACSTQDASVYQDQALTIAITPNVTGDAYGNFWFWAAPGTYYYTVTGTVGGGTVTGTYQLQLPAAISGSTLSVPVFNATTGFKYNSAAPLNHVLLGNGTYYVDSATIPASIVSGLPGTYYQTVQSQGTNQAQESHLNFASALFSLSDASGNGQTNVNVNLSGTGTYAVTATAQPGTSTALAKWDGAGNLTTSPLQLLGSNSYLQTVSSSWSDQWFTILSPCAIATSTDAGCTGTITIPTAEPDSLYYVTITVNSTGGAFIFAAQNGSQTTTTIPYLASCSFNCTNTAYSLSVHVHHN